MLFKELYLEEPAKISLTLQHLSYNLFLIKYFYEEDQLEKLSRMFKDLSTQHAVINDYQKVADEATIYLQVLNGFRRGHYNLKDDKDKFEAIIDYFNYKKEDLLNFELSNPSYFFNWIENREYNTDTSRTFPHL